MTWLLYDPKWEPYARKIVPVLSVPRDWVFLNAWARDNGYGSGFFRECLAWLEDRGLARTISIDGLVHWVGRQALSPSGDSGGTF